MLELNKQLILDDESNSGKGDLIFKVGTFKKFISVDSFGFMSAILFREPVL